MQVSDVVSSCKFLIDRTIGTPSLKWHLIFIIIVFSLFKIILSIAKTKKNIRLLQKNCSEDLPKKLQDLVKFQDLETKQVVISCSDELIAVTIGFFDRKIIFSRSLVNKLSKKELEAVLLHEIYHLKNHHSVVLLIGEIITSTLFFLPIMEDVFVNLKTEFEKRADSAAVNQQKTTKYVKRSLLKVLSVQSDLSPHPQFAYHVLEHRLDNLNNLKSKYIFSIKKAAFSFVMLVLMSVLSHFNSVYAMAIDLGDQRACGLLECVQNCVVDELVFDKNPMTPNNFSSE